MRRQRATTPTSRRLSCSGCGRLSRCGIQRARRQQVVQHAPPRIPGLAAASAGAWADSSGQRVRHELLFADCLHYPSCTGCTCVAMQNSRRCSGACHQLHPTAKHTSAYAVGHVQVRQVQTEGTGEGGLQGVCAANAESTQRAALRRDLHTWCPHPSGILDSPRQDRPGILNQH